MRDLPAALLLLSDPLVPLLLLLEGVDLRWTFDPAADDRRAADLGAVEPFLVLV